MASEIDLRKIVILTSKSSKPRLALAHASVSVVKDRVPFVFTLRDLKIFEQHGLRPGNVFLDKLILTSKFDLNPGFFLFFFHF